MSSPYTVVLMYPDYLTDAFGQDAFTAYVEADDVKSAVEIGQKAAMKAQPSRMRRSHKDFFPVATFEGHHKNLTPIWN